MCTLIREKSYKRKKLSVYKVLYNNSFGVFLGPYKRTTFCPFIRERSHFWAFSYKRTPQYHQTQGGEKPTLLYFNRYFPKPGGEVAK